MADFNISALLSAKDLNFSSTFKEAQAKIKGLQESMSKTATNFKAAGDKMTGVGTKLGLGLTAPLLLFGKQAVDTASDLAEVQNVVNTTFGDSAGVIDKFSKEAKAKFGMSELSAKQFTGTIGAMLKSMDLAPAQVTEMSTSLAGLSGDMASFYNLDPTEAFEKLRAGISGEAEPLKQLGINMSQANLEAYALAQGLTKPIDKMSQAELATLRYNYIMKATKDAQGDFAKTSDGAANQFRVLQLTMSELSATIGAILLPTVVSIVGKFKGLLDMFQNLDPNVQKTIVTFGLVAAAIGPVLIIVGQMTSGVGSLMSAFSLLMGPIGLVVGAIALVASGFVYAYQNSEEFRGFLDNLIGTLQAMGGSFQEVFGGIMSLDFGRVSSGLSDIWDSLDLGQKTTDAVVPSILGMFGAIGQQLPNFINTAFSKVGDILNNILLPQISKVGATIIAMMPVIFNGMLTFFKDIFTKVDWVGIGVLVGQSLGNLVNVFIQLGTSFVDAFTKIDWASVGSLLIIQLGAMLQLLITQLGAMLQLLITSIFTFITTVDWMGLIGTVFGIIGAAFIALSGIILGAITQLLTSIFGPIMEPFNALFTSIGDGFNACVVAIGVALNPIIGFFTNIFKTITDMLSPFKAAFQLILDALKNYFLKVFTFWATTAQLVFSGITAIWSGIVGFFSPIFQTVGNAFKNVFDGISNVASNVWNGIVYVWNSASGFFSNLFNGISNIASNVWNGISNTISNVFNGVRNAWSGLSSFASNVTNGIANAFSQVAQTIKNVINKPIGGINWALDVINKIPGVSVPKIPYLARGTDNWGGGFAVMNEYGKGELVNLPNGSQVIPHDISMKYAKESARIGGNESNRVDVYVTVENKGDVYLDGKKIADVSWREVERNIEKNSFRKRGALL